MIIPSFSEDALSADSDDESLSSSSESSSSSASSSSSSEDEDEEEGERLDSMDESTMDSTTEKEYDRFVPVILSILHHQTFPHDCCNLHFFCVIFVLPGKITKLLKSKQVCQKSLSCCNMTKSSETCRYSSDNHPFHSTACKQAYNIYESTSAEQMMS